MVVLAVDAGVRQADQGPLPVGSGLSSYLGKLGVVGLSVRKNSRRMQKLRAEFFAEGKRLDAHPLTRSESVCWLCDQRIDYDAEPGTTEDSHELDHMVPVSERPDLQEDPTNFRHAHRRCNGQRSNRMPTAGLGQRVSPWW